MAQAATDTTTLEISQSAPAPQLDTTNRTVYFNGKMVPEHEARGDLLFICVYACSACMHVRARVGDGTISVL